MHGNRVLQELSGTACPSICYRINTELAGQSAPRPRLRSLQHRILQDPVVAATLGWQQPDGWLAWDFHGSRSIETGIRVLCEKGLDRRHPLLKRAARALADHPERLDRGIGKVGQILDDMGFGGSQMIRATLFAYLGIADRAIKPQVDVALAGFQSLLAVDSVAELIEPYRGKPVFRPGVQFPGIYHLRLLAWTGRWRTASNLKMLAAALARLIALSPLPQASVRHKSQMIAPPSFAMHDFNADMGALDDAGWMMWFHRMECLARLGIVPQIPELIAQTARLEEILQQGAGYFTKKLSHPYFTKWGAYTGLMLEQDWRVRQRRVNDLTFRSLLVLHWTKQSPFRG